MGEMMRMMERNGMQNSQRDPRKDPHREAVREAAPVWLAALAGMMLIMFFANGIMVWLSLRGHRDLVRPDYYDAGLDQDAAMARAALSLEPGMDIAFFRGAAGWQAEASAEILKTATCRVLLYRPDNRGEDRILEWGMPSASLASPGRMLWKGTAPSLRRGRWEARLVWEVDGKAIMEKPYQFYVPG
jgi:hypothetical protein